jgi:Dolichyl-phosphate-mannose-protein mannosyltransferase
MTLKQSVPTVDMALQPMADASTLTLDPVPPRTTEAPAPSPARSPAPSAAPASTPSSRVLLGAAALIIVAGGAIRFAALSTSIWFDESVSVRDVSGSFGQMLHRVINHEASPPFYFICLWLWRQIVGSTAVDLRAMSAVAGTITIALAFYVARRRIGQRAALVLALCVAVSPVLIYYSTEMRMYALLVLITGIGFEAFLRASESPSARRLTVWAVASILALWTQYYAALAIAPEAMLLLAVAWRSRLGSRATVVAVGSVVVGVLPLAYLMAYQARHAWAYGGPLVSSTWQKVPLNIHDTGSTFGTLAQDVLVGPAGPARALLTALILSIGVVAGVLALRSPQTTRRHLIRAFCVIAPTLLVVEIVVSAHVLVEGRYLLPLWLPVGLGVTYALASPSAGRLGLALVGALVCVWAGIVVVSSVVPRYSAQDDTLGAARSLGVADTNRLIAINEPWDVVPLEAYRPKITSDTSATVHVRELDVVAMPVGAEPSPSEHERPSSIGAGVVPRGLRLVQVIRGSTFLVERFVSSTPVAVRVDGRGNAFRARSWRFLNEPAGSGMGSL